MRMNPAVVAEFPDWSTIQAAIQRIAGFAGHWCEFLPTTGSTNDEVKQQITGFQSPSRLLVAGRQTCGRGQFGRTWIDSGPVATGTWPALLFSFTWSLPAASIPPLVLTIPAGVALYRALLGLGSVPGALWLKWPNDLVGTSGKVAGILVEGTTFPQGATYVIGVGINLSESVPRAFPELGASSLQAAGIDPDPGRVLVAFLQEWDRLWSPWCETEVIGTFTEAAAPFLRGRYRCRLPEFPEPVPVQVDGLDAGGGLWISGKQTGRRLLVDARNLLAEKP